MMDKSARKKLSNAFIVSLLSCTILNASGRSAVAEAGGNGSFLEKIFSGNKSQSGPSKAAVPAAGAADTTIAALEEEVRQLTGKVEELNFMILQMQAQLDELRQTKGLAGAGTGQPAANTAAGLDRKPDKMAQAATPPAIRGAEAKSSEDLGSIRFDQQGNVIGSDSKATAAGNVPAGGNVIADVPQTGTAQELYQIGYQHVLAGDYRAAETVFRAFQERYPDDAMAGDASFWLGEALYGQGRYREAAQVYIDVQRKYKGSNRGPENLLKLGMSMALLDEKEVACATLAEVPKRYKKAEPAVLKRVSDERSRIKCP